MAETSKSTTKDKAAKTKKESHKEQEKLLNRELEDSFPASDPPSLTQPTTGLTNTPKVSAPRSMLRQSRKMSTTEDFIAAGARGATH